MKPNAKKILSILVLSTTIMGFNVSPSLASQISFKDVSSDFWGIPNIQWAIDNKLVDGYPDGTFKPNQNVEQTEFLAMLIRANQPSDFVQTSETNNWSAPYIQYALKMGWKVIAPSSLQGHSNPVYLTRGMVAQYIANAAGKNYSMDDSIQYLLDSGLSEGKTGKSIIGFKKEDPVTRTEAITFIQRLGFVNGGTLVASPAKKENYLNTWHSIQFDPSGTKYGENPISSMLVFKTNPSNRNNDGAPFYEYGAPFTVYLGLINVTEPTTVTPTKPVELIAQVYNVNGDEVWEGKLPPLVDQIKGNKGGQEILFQWNQKDLNGNQVPAGEYYLKLKSPATIEYTVDGKSGTQTTNIVGQSRPGIQQTGAKFFIQPSNFQTEKINKMIQLAANTQMYQTPSKSVKVLGTLEPQYVKAIVQMNNWYQIESSWVGNAWIYVEQNRTNIVNVDEIDQEIDLTANTVMYQGPSTSAKDRGTLAPQTVHAFEKSGNWYHIYSTWANNAWIFVDSSTREETAPGVVTFKGLQDPGEPRVFIENLTISSDSKGIYRASGNIKLLSSYFAKNDVLCGFELFDKDGNRISRAGANAVNVGIGERGQLYSLGISVDPAIVTNVKVKVTIQQAQ